MLSYGPMNVKPFIIQLACFLLCFLVMIHPISERIGYELVDMPVD